MKRLSVRILSILLCAAMLLGAFSVAISAQEPAEAAIVLEEEAPATLAQDEPTGSKFWEYFFKIFGFLGYLYEPNEGYVYNRQPTWNWLGGFNALYDALTFTAHVYADVIKIKFNYEGKDWMIQCWKGGYAVCLSTGGEIGVYNKSETSSVDHYGAAVMDDWLKMSMTIYNKNARLLTRPFEKYWWCTGYALSICTDFLSRPRKNVVMDTTIELKDAAMAELFAAELAAKGFQQIDNAADLGLGNTDKFVMLDDITVRFTWQKITESWY